MWGVWAELEFPRWKTKAQAPVLKGPVAEGRGLPVGRVQLSRWKFLWAVWGLD